MANTASLGFSLNLANNQNRGLELLGNLNRVMLRGELTKITPTFGDNISSANSNEALDLILNQPEKLNKIYDIAINNANLEIEQKKKKGVSEQELSEMDKAKSILEMGKMGAEDLIQSKETSASANISFCGSKEVRMKKNHIIIHTSATAAAASAAALAQVPGGDEAALTAITLGMAGALCNNYGSMETSIISACGAQAVGAAAGKMASSYLYKWIPGAGNAINAAVTFALHEATGWSLVAMLEKYKQSGILGNIKDFKDAGKDLKNEYSHD